MKERMSVRARNAHAAGIEWRISAKIRALLEKEALLAASTTASAETAAAIASEL